MVNPPAPHHPFARCEPIVAIGASGSQGLQDIVGLLERLPASLHAIVMVVLHRPADRISSLRAVLARRSALPVRVAGDGERLRPGCCYIGEPDAHLTLATENLGLLLPDPPDHLRNRTIDALFESVARYAGAQMIGVVLSGSLDDGSRGLAAIHKAGGVTMALIPGAVETSAMATNAIDFDGPLDCIGTPERLAAEIVARIGHGLWAAN